MATLTPEVSLPTLPRLGNPKIPETLDAVDIANTWTAIFRDFVASGDVDKIGDVMVESSFESNIFRSPDNIAPTNPDDVPVYWRDLLALTWDIRTFEGTPKIRKFLSDRLGQAKISHVELAPEMAPRLLRPMPDLVWVQFGFKFETEIGLCSGIAKLVPIANKSSQTLVWKAFSLFTQLDDLKSFPEKVGALRKKESNHGKWESARKEEVAFEGRDPAALIIGGGHSGLMVAARLKTLGVSTLIIEKNAKIGDNWRTRYEALCLHDPVWFDHMPYIPFPPTWPVFTPAKKLANWLEFYADALELNVWTSSTVTKATQDPKMNIWSVVVKKDNGTERVFNVKNVVLAIGFKGGKGYMPSIPGMDVFGGKILHSSEHHKATDHTGKKVVVIGAGSSASYSETSPPAELSDKAGASMNNLFMAGLNFRLEKILANADKATLDGLKARGFKVNNGWKDTGLMLTVFNKAGSHYIDVGGSQYIIDGRLKLKSDSLIKEISPGGIRFEDGSELPADVIIFATGLSQPRDVIRPIFGDEVADKSIQMWGLNEEGEINGCYRDIGFKGLYNIMGNLQLCRLYSKPVALQIKASEEGLFNGERYSL
ncbi:hypothetical protein BJ912DRAFT_1022034 [Pholiota molesta]|nr:hypothetical protein BJ912DRAFT_1022034 [Pholiota molesta]